MSGPVQLANGALGLLGASMITSLDDPTEEARRAASLLPDVLAEMAALWDWPELILRAQLVALHDPASPWPKFMLPVDCVVLRTVNGLDLGPEAPDGDRGWWRVEGRCLVGPAGALPPSVEYLAAPSDPDQMPPLVKRAAMYRLAGLMAYALTGDVRLGQAMGAAADKEIAQAKQAAKRRPAVPVVRQSRWLGGRG